MYSKKTLKMIESIDGKRMDLRRLWNDWVSSIPTQNTNKYVNGNIKNIKSAIQRRERETGKRQLCFRRTLNNAIQLSDTNTRLDSLYELKMDLNGDDVVNQDIYYRG